jgi:hypothetical protein
MSQTKPLKKVALITGSGRKGTLSGQRGRQAAAPDFLNIVHKRPIPGSLSSDALASDLGSTPAHNLRFRGGRTIRSLTYLNLYVGGKEAWAADDIQDIDRALAAVMTDSRLDTVINQYFPDGSVATAVAPSQVLPGPKSRTVTRATMDALVREHVMSAGRLNQFDPATTLFNFLLPRGVVLTTDGGAQAIAKDPAPSPFSVNTVTTIRSGDVVTTVTVATTAAVAASTGVPDDDSDGGRKGGPLGGDPDDAASSLGGLGGYHGSVHAGGAVIYFAAASFPNYCRTATRTASLLSTSRGRIWWAPSTMRCRRRGQIRTSRTQSAHRIVTSSGGTRTKARKLAISRSSKQTHFNKFLRRFLW